MARRRWLPARGPVPARGLPGHHRRTGADPIFEGYPDVAIELLESRTFDRGLQLLAYAPRMLEGPPESVGTGA